MAESTNIGLSIGSCRREDRRETGTSINWYGLKEGVTPEDLDKGLKELVRDLYADGNYEPEGKQPELAFYDNQEIEFRLNGKAKDLDEGNLVVVIKTEAKSNWRKVLEYNLEVELVHREGLEGVGRVIRDRVTEFALKYTNFTGHPDCDE